MNSNESPKFDIGQVIHHRLYGYRGVIIRVHETFQGSEEWYSAVAASKPPRDRPWYHVLVHNVGQQTYVAQRNLEPDSTGEPVSHPELSRHFDLFDGGRYDRYLN